MEQQGVGDELNEMRRRRDGLVVKPTSASAAPAMASASAAK